MSNTMLEFDFEGNAVGDRGLVAMLQAMQSSASLTFVSLDNNGMSLSTYEALIETLIGGDGRINVPMPVIDIKRIFKVGHGGGGPPSVCCVRCERSQDRKGGSPVISLPPPALFFFSRAPF